MICRSCGYKTLKYTQLHSYRNVYSHLLLESTLFKCNVYSCVECYHLQLQDFSKKDFKFLWYNH